MTKEPLMEPLTTLWRVGIPSLSKHRLDVQGHHFPIADINRIGDEARAPITLNRNMWHNWKELENTQIHSMNFPIRNKEKEREISKWV